MHTLRDCKHHAEVRGGTAAGPPPPRPTAADGGPKRPAPPHASLARDGPHDTCRARSCPGPPGPSLQLAMLRVTNVGAGTQRGRDRVTTGLLSERQWRTEAPRRGISRAPAWEGCKARSSGLICLLFSFNFNASAGAPDPAGAASKRDCTASCEAAVAATTPAPSCLQCRCNACFPSPHCSPCTVCPLCFPPWPFCCPSLRWSGQQELWAALFRRFAFHPTVQMAAGCSAPIQGPALLHHTQSHLAACPDTHDCWARLRLQCGVHVQAAVLCCAVCTSCYSFHCSTRYPLARIHERSKEPCPSRMANSRRSRSASWQE